MPTPSAAWLAAAQEAAITAGQSAGVRAIALLAIPGLALYYATASVAGITAVPIIARLSEGGVGPITRQLDERTDEYRFADCTVTLVRTAALSTALLQQLQRQACTVELGFVGLDRSDYWTLLAGHIDRVEIESLTARLSIVDPSMRWKKSLSVSLRPSDFPDAPLSSRRRAIPIFLGNPTVELIPVTQQIRTRVAGDVLKEDDSLPVYDTSTFPTNGNILVRGADGVESMGYASKGGSVLAGLERDETQEEGVYIHRKEFHSGDEVILAPERYEFVAGFRAGNISALVGDGGQALGGFAQNDQLIAGPGGPSAFVTTVAITESFAEPVLATMTGASGNGVALLRAFIAAYLPGATFDEASFTAAIASQDATFAAVLTNAGESDALLWRMADQCDCVLYVSRAGAYTLVPRDFDRAPVWDFGVHTIYEGTFRLASQPISDLYTQFIVWYGTNVFSQNPGDFEHFSYCDHQVSTLVSPDPAPYIALCAEALATYGERHRLEVLADLLGLTGAGTLLRSKVRQHTTLRHLLTFQAPLVATRYDLTTPVRVTHPDLDHLGGTLTGEIVRLVDHLSEGCVEITVRSFPPALE